jgi:hypothetical protein
MARSSAGARVAVTGEPCGGKTALVQEALDRARGLRVLRSGCDAPGTPRPDAASVDAGPAHLARLVLGDFPVLDGLTTVHLDRLGLA